MKNLVLASCSLFDKFHPEGLKIASNLFSAPIGSFLVHQAVDKRFPDSEVCVDLPVFCVGATVYLFQSLCNEQPEGPDAALFALFAAARGYKEFGARRVVAVVPYLAYSRQDRSILSERRPLTARLLADLLSSSGVDELLTIRAGSKFNLQKQYAHPVLTQVDFFDFMVDCASRYDPQTTVLIAPDFGALKDVERVAETTGHRVISAHKHRFGPEDVTSKLTSTIPLDGICHGLILDDLVCSAGTVAAAIKSLAPWRIRRFSVATPHCRLTDTGITRLQSLSSSGLLDCLHTTDTVPMRCHAPFLEVTPFMTAFRTALSELLIGLEAQHGG